MCIYNTGSRTALMESLKDMRQYLEDGEQELSRMTESVLHKLEGISDAEFDELELFPDFVV